MPSVARARRALSGGALGKAALLGAVLLAALLVSRSCGATAPAVTQDDAIEIAKREIEYEPDRVQVRVMRRGIPPRLFWAVSLQTLDRDEELERTTVVLIDGKTGEVDEVRVAKP